MSTTPAPNGTHPEVHHPHELEQNGFKAMGRFNDWAMSHLALVFGLAWTVWLFMIYPLALLLTPKTIQDHGFFLSSGWIQLWALPLFVFVGNKLQRKTDAQSDAMYQALTHIATIEDQNNKLLAQNTEITEAIHALVSGKGTNGDVQPVPSVPGTGVERPGELAERHDRDDPAHVGLYPEPGH